MNELIPAKYTCDGENVSPPLRFGDIPSGAQSFVLINDDPDAPMGTWVHWVVYNIAPTVTDVPEGMIPAGGAEGKTSFGHPGYGGPCPPAGTHRYIFKLYALDTIVRFAETPTAEELEYAMQGHILARAELVGLYGH